MPKSDEEIVTYPKAAPYEYGDIVTLFRIRNSPDMIVECELSEDASKAVCVREGVRVFWFGGDGTKEVGIFPKSSLHWGGSIADPPDDDDG